jgi:glutamate synthase domain-containing protein 1
MVFLPVEPPVRLQCEGVVERIVQEEGLSVLGWRDTPINVDAIGRIARTSQPYIEQLFISRGSDMTREQFGQPEWVKHQHARIPMGRVGRLEELAGAAIFFASSASDYVTGQILYVDGGYLSAL